MSDETRVKESLNMAFHGVKTSERSTLFREVREWLEEMDDTSCDDNYDEEGDSR